MYCGVLHLFSLATYVEGGARVVYVCPASVEVAICNAQVLAQLLIHLTYSLNDVLTINLFKYPLRSIEKHTND